MTAENKIRRGFADAGRCIDISGNLGRRLLTDQIPPVIRLADHFIAGGQIADNGRPCGCVTGTGCLRNPHILAKFNRQT